LVFPTLADTSI